MAGISEDELKVLFREQELQRRAARLAAISKNYAQLQDETKDPGILKLDKEVQARLHAHEDYLHQRLHKGYWRTLWAALCGKLHEPIRARKES